MREWLIFIVVEALLVLLLVWGVLMQLIVGGIVQFVGAFHIVPINATAFAWGIIRILAALPVGVVLAALIYAMIGNVGGV